MAKVRGPQAARGPDVVSSGTQATISHIKTRLDPYYGHDELSQICARFIEHVFSCPEILPQSTLMSPTPINPPTLTQFIAYVLHRTHLHPAVLINAIAFLHRLKARFPAARGSSGHLMFLTAYMIASKLMCDDTHPYKSWVVFGQGMFMLTEVIQMEKEICSYLEWQLCMPRQDLVTFEEELRNIYSHPPPYSHSYAEFPFVGMKRGMKRVAVVPANGVDEQSIRRRRTSRPTESENIAPKNVSKDLQASLASRIRADVGRLEDKAVSVASTNSSAAEVSLVYEEIQAWLGSEDNKLQEGEHFSLLMSSALLRLVMNDRTSDSQTAEHEESKAIF